MDSSTSDNTVNASNEETVPPGLQLEFIRAKFDQVNSSSHRCAEMFFIPPDPSRKVHAPPEEYYLRPVLIWEPLKQFPEEVIRHLTCPHCSSEVPFKQGSMQVRRVLGDNDYFFFVYKRYTCRCNKRFNNSDAKVVAAMPTMVSNSLQVVVRNKLALTPSLQEHMYKLHLQVGVEKTAELLNCRYVQTYRVKHTQYLAQASMQLEKKEQKKKLQEDPNSIRAHFERLHAENRARRQAEESLTEEQKELKAKLENLKARYDAAKHLRGLPLSRVKSIGEGKMNLLRSIPSRLQKAFGNSCENCENNRCSSHFDRKFLEEFVHLNKYMNCERGITRLLELAQFPIEVLDFSHAPGRLEAALLTKKNVDRTTLNAVSKEPQRGRLRSLVRTWVTLAREKVFELSGKNEIHFDQVDKIIEQYEEIESELRKMRQEEQEDPVAAPTPVPLETETVESPRPPPPTDFGAYDKKNAFEGYFFSASTVGSLCREVFAQRQATLVQSMASHPSDFLSFDSHWKIGKIVRVTDEGSQKQVPFVNTLVCGMNGLGQVVMLLLQQYFERNDELEQSLIQFRDCQKKVRGENWRLKACWTDDCCKRSALIHKVFGPECKSLLDLFHWMSRFKDFVIEPSTNPRLPEFMKKLSEAVLLCGEDAERYLAKRNMKTSEVVFVSDGSDDSNGNEGCQRQQSKQRYKTEIDIIPDPETLKERVDKVLDFFERLDCESRLSNAVEKVVNQEKATIAVRKAIEKNPDISEAALRAIRESHFVLPQPILFHQTRQMNGKTVSFFDFRRSQMRHVLNGCLSDPLDVGPLFYRDVTGKLRSARGTSKVEGFFRKVRHELTNGSTVGVYRTLSVLLELAHHHSEKIRAKLFGDRVAHLLSREHQLLLNSFFRHFDVTESQLPFPYAKAYSIKVDDLQVGFARDALLKLSEDSEASDSALAKHFETNLLASIDAVIQSPGVTLVGGDRRRFTEVVDDGRGADRAFFATLFSSLELLPGGLQKICEILQLFPSNSLIDDPEGRTEVLSKISRIQLGPSNSNLTVMLDLHSPNLGLFEEKTNATTIRTSTAEDALKFFSGAREFVREFFVFCRENQDVQNNVVWLRSVQDNVGALLNFHSSNAHERIIKAGLHLDDLCGLTSLTRAALQWQLRTLPDEEHAGVFFLKLLCDVIHAALSIKIRLTVYDGFEELQHVIESEGGAEPELNVECSIKIDAGEFYPLISTERPQEPERVRRREGLTEGHQMLVDVSGILQRAAPFSYAPQYMLERIIFYKLMKSPRFSQKNLAEITSAFNRAVQKRSCRVREKQIKMTVKGQEVRQYLRLKTDLHVKDFLEKAKRLLETSFNSTRRRVKNWSLPDLDLSPKQATDIFLDEFFVVADYQWQDKFEDAGVVIDHFTEEHTGQEVGALSISANLVQGVVADSKRMPFVLQNRPQMANVPVEINFRRICKNCLEPIAGAHSDRRHGKSCPRPRREFTPELLQRAQEISSRPPKRQKVCPKTSFLACIDGFRSVQGIEGHAFEMHATQVVCGYSAELKRFFAAGRMDDDLAIPGMTKPTWASFSSRNVRTLMPEVNSSLWLDITSIMRGLLAFQAFDIHLYKEHRPRWSFRHALNLGLHKHPRRVTLVHSWESAHGGLDSSVILCPVLSGCHWTLLTVYPEEKKMGLYNSLPSSDDGVFLERIGRIIHSELVSIKESVNSDVEVAPWDSWELKVRKCAKQPNGDDCGAIVLLNAYFLRKQKSVPSSYVPDVLRANLLAMILRFGRFETASGQPDWVPGIDVDVSLDSSKEEAVDVSTP